MAKFYAATTYGLVTFLLAERGAASAAVVVAHAVMIVPVVLLGLYCLWREGLSFRSLRETVTSTDEGEGER